MFPDSISRIRSLKLAGLGAIAATALTIGLSATNVKPGSKLTSPVWRTPVRD